MKLLLKPLDPVVEAVSKIRPPIRLKKLIHNPKELHAQLRRIKILEYAARQEKRTALEKENDYQELTDDQQEWVKTRMRSPTRSWERWFVGQYFTQEQKKELGLTDLDIEGEGMA